MTLLLLIPVSYTHLDVYKRQAPYSATKRRLEQKIRRYQLDIPNGFKPSNFA